MVSKMKTMLLVSLTATVSSLGLHSSDLAIAQELKRVVSVRDSVELKHPMSFLSIHGLTNVHISPDGSRYVIFLQKGNLKAGGIDVEVITGPTSSTEAAVRYRTAARLFTTARRSVEIGTFPPTVPFRNRIQWLNDSATIAFLWSNGAEPNQVVSLNLETKEFKRLTSSATAVRQFSITPDGKRVVFVPSPSLDKSRTSRRLKEGFAVDTLDLPAILRGEDGAWAAWSVPTYYVADAPNYSPRKVWTPSFPVSTESLGWPSISPDGERILIPSFPVEKVDPTWKAYTDPAVRHAMSTDDRQNEGGNITTQARLIDIRLGTSRPLWNVPGGHGTSERIAVVWSPDGDRVMFGPTLLPLSAGSGESVHRRAVVEFEIESDEWRLIPLSTAEVKSYRPIRWVSDQIEFHNSTSTSLTFTRSGTNWIPVSDKRVRKPASPVRVEVRESFNSPPRIVAVSRLGDEKVVLDLNPQLGRSILLGGVEKISWRAADGRELKGRLYYPVDYKAGRRYPLIVQTHGNAEENEFSLTGPSQRMGTAFAAHPLAGRGFLVVQVGGERDHIRDKSDLQYSGEADAAMSVYESVVDYLVRRGLADPQRLGIIGYSRSGWWVEHTLVNSRLDFDAAVVADNMEPSYGQYLLHGPMRSGLESAIGAAPFANGLRTWMQRSPGFNLHRICAALRLENSQGGLVGLTGLWETFSMLTQLKRPVELYTIPESDSGYHPLHMPMQILASQEGTVDWFDFWLNGREHLSEEKKDQYLRWRRLRQIASSNQCIRK